MDALREKLEHETHQRRSVEEELAQLKSRPEPVPKEGGDSEGLQQSATANGELSQLEAELASKNKKLDDLVQTTAVLEAEVAGLKEKARQLQVEKDKAVSDLIALRKSHKIIER